MNFNQLIDSKWTIHAIFSLLRDSFSFETRVTHKITKKKKKWKYGNLTTTIVAKRKQNFFHPNERVLNSK